MITLRYVFTVLAMALITACGAPKKAAVEAGDEKRVEKTDPRTAERVTAVFIDAGKEKALGNYRQAINLYRQCLSLDPDHAPSMYELARIYRASGNVSEALVLAEKAAKSDPENKWYQLLLASVYEQSGQHAKAINTFESLLAIYPEEIALMYDLSMLYLKENRFAEAIEVYNKIEMISGPDEDIVLQRKQLYLLNDQPAEAVKEIEKLISMYPGESRYYAMLAELYLDLDNYPKAIENLEKIRELDPQNPYIHITLAEYYFKTGDRQRAFKELKDGFANPSLDVEIKFQVLFTYYTDEEMSGEHKDEVSELTEILVATHPRDARPYSLKADLLIREENYEEAAEAFRKALEIDSSRYFMWETLLRINAMLRNDTILLDESLKVIELFPLQPLPYLFAGLAHYQLGDYADAVKMYERGLDLVVDDDDLLVDFYMQAGDAYSKLKQHQASDEAFDKALAIDPDNPYALNNYSYYLALRKERLEKAKTMSERSLELSPGNKHYLDTYGWILYQMGNYEEARIWIEKSIENNASEDAVVLEHLGDVLYKLGKKEEALKYWKQALESGDDVTEFLEKKVKDGVLYE